MHQLNRCERAVRLGSIISVAVLMVACQEPDHHAVTAKSPVASSQATSQASASQPPAPVVAYTPRAAVGKPLTRCNLEYVGAVPLLLQPVILENEQSSIFKGWIDGSGFTQPLYWLKFDDPTANRYLQMPVVLTISRPDVQAVDPNAPLASGFSAHLSANALPAGHYHVYLAVESGGTIHICDNGRHAEVKP